MKKILMIFAVLAVAVLAVAASGCLSSDSGLETNTTNNTTNNMTNNTTVTGAPAQSVIIYTDGDNVIAQMVVMIMGTHSQSIDKANATVNVSGTTVDVYVPAVTVSGINTMDIGYEDVTVVLGKVSDFEAGKKYVVTIDGKSDAMKQYGFEIVNGTLYSYRPANIDNVTVAADGNNITVTAVVAIGGGANSIDKENITTVDGFNADGEYDIYIPLKVKDGPSTMEMKWGDEKFVIGQLDKMKDGTYVVKINDYGISFTIAGGQLTVNA
ncbi:hypothetical protein MmiAt1_04160 [Methanimicrococcus sp. At1]|uniref:DUF4382 domain-containing protein n=1 Tax=Methanimicrococcus hacksteinii TaxID=3028293 RepID=A0ABU3VN87_9EURY|nr:hypothetical protein [Methanimicrococcus sp. At1]MDV0444871.1 hypothetical protein [Methanimicrococcus sp. At1]